MQLDSLLVIVSTIHDDSGPNKSNAKTGIRTETCRDQNRLIIYCSLSR